MNAACWFILNSNLNCIAVPNGAFNRHRLASRFVIYYSFLSADEANQKRAADLFSEAERFIWFAASAEQKYWIMMPGMAGDALSRDFFLFFIFSIIFNFFHCFLIFWCLFSDSPSNLIPEGGRRSLGYEKYRKIDFLIYAYIFCDFVMLCTSSVEVPGHRDCRKHLQTPTEKFSPSISSFELSDFEIRLSAVTFGRFDTTAKN